tara:strand:- start:317 stop:529 length:213 start_codon:yes stop_codon:yes gene_type:complete
MDDELKAAVEFAKGLGATRVFYENASGSRIEIEFSTEPKAGFAIPDQYLISDSDEEQDEDEDLLFYSSGG